MKSLSNLCYNVPDQSIYGELTDNSIAKLTVCIGVSSNMKILDIGSGSGATLCAFAKFLPKSSCELIGIEISHLRADISRQVIPYCLPSNVNKWSILEVDVLNIKQIPPCQVCFSFDTTFTQDLMMHIIKLQLNCLELCYVISSKKSCYYDPDLWTTIATIPCKLKGSGQTISFYVRTKKTAI